MGTGMSMEIPVSKRNPRGRYCLCEMKGLSGDQAALKHFEYYNKLVVISGQAVSHISECMSPEFFKVVPC